MVEQTAKVRLQTGLQARPAAHFVRIANRFQAEITLVRGDKQVNAKSIMGVMSLAVAPGSDVTIRAEGHDENEAVAALIAFVSQEQYA
ncbi:MAG: Catabolite repression HPr-like protein Crh [Candidatus Carbobacillus altaicus]|uniref:Catabolite repression HPr-like protein Crh n=1 Tax=Candidatus Carbonibacillus altaicus TaxID=2163959 RepID=A0A2R6XYM9_9BACL|nr:MAG: Catabolite repression HPr-like protein Crh [Candidatus Carbobacillus altaicus]